MYKRSFLGILALLFASMGLLTGCLIDSNIYGHGWMENCSTRVECTKEDGKEVCVTTNSCSPQKKEECSKEDAEAGRCTPSSQSDPKEQPGSHTRRDPKASDKGAKDGGSGSGSSGAGNGGATSGPGKDAGKGKSDSQGSCPSSP